MVSGIETTDFETFILGDLGQAVTWENVTKTTSNVTGSRTLSYATGVSKTVIFLRRNVIHQYEKSGLIEQGDAYIMAKTGDGFARNDRITVSGVKYRIEKVIRRNPDGSTAMFDMCTLFRIE